MFDPYGVVFFCGLCVAINIPPLRGVFFEGGCFVSPD